MVKADLIQEELCLFPIDNLQVFGLEQWIEYAVHTSESVADFASKIRICTEDILQEDED